MSPALQVDFLPTQPLGKPPGKSIGTSILIELTHFLSLHHILVILAIFQTFKKIIFVVVMRIADLWCYCCNCSGYHKPSPCKTRNLMINVCVLTAPPTGNSPIFLLLLRPPYSLRHNSTEIRSMNNTAMTSKHSSASAAQSFQSSPTLCDPIDSSSPGSPVPGILQERTLEWVAISFSNKHSRERKS